MKYFYGVLSVFGVLLPYASFVPWVSEHGLNLSLLISEIQGSQISSFAWRDVFVSAVALITFILVEGNYLKMKLLWLPIVGTCVVGVSLGLPLFLMLRQIHLEARTP